MSIAHIMTCRWNTPWLTPFKVAGKRPGQLPLADAETPASLINSGAIHGTFDDVGRYLLSPNRQDVMDAKDRKVAESAFNKNERREAEITSALRQEQAKHEAAVKNMHRLRLLRLQRDAQEAASEAVSE
jgi:hypothetical protein